jgi:lipoprotein-anchoring transpeptidase ErfK/SrfK
VPSVPSVHTFWGSRRLGTSEAAARRPSRRSLLLLAVAVLLVAALGVVAATSLAYGSTVRGGDRLLAGTTIASVEVGEISAQEATELLTARLDERLDRTITVRHGDTTWTTSPRELGATTDLDDVVATAAARAADLGFVDLVQLRWLGSESQLTADVSVDVPADEVERFVAGLVDELDREPRDAEVAWEDDAVVLTGEGRDGRTVRRDEAVAALTDAATGDTDEVVVPLDRTAPDVPTDLALAVAADVTGVVDTALDRPVTVVLEGKTETVTPRDVGAVPTVEPLVARALTGGDVDAGDVEVNVPDGALVGLLDRVSEGTVVPARDASLDTSGDSFRVIPEVVGAAIDRDAAGAEIRAALSGASDRVELSLSPLRPRVTVDSFDRVLVVDQSSTTLSLLIGGEVARTWPVAVGTNNSPTPLGTFVVGAKRFEPTWVNPAPDRWGKDMPARIGPGPDNPLGVRAINWNRPGGGDTLIRFHGTPNEASIGTAASNGCVRMFNRDVIELYDLVSPGMTIISQA